MKKENLETADFEFRNNFERIRFPHFLLFCHRARPKHFDNHMAKILEYHWLPRKNFIFEILPLRISARLAARTFSLIPPTAWTIWLSEISPVMAIFGRFVEVANDNNAVVIVTPAYIQFWVRFKICWKFKFFDEKVSNEHTCIQTVPDGPSFGVAPSGKWRWIRLSLKNDSYSVPRTIFRATVYEMSDDSFITSFILPVTLRPPLFLGHQEVIFFENSRFDFADPCLYPFRFLQRLIQHTMQIHPLMSKQDQQQFQVGLYHTFYPYSRLPDRQNLLNYQPRQKHFLH